MKGFKSSPRKQGGWIQVAAFAASAGFNAITGRRARSKARKAGKLQGALIWQTFLENRRRKTLQDEQRIGAANLAVAASNIQRTGTSALYITEMQAEIDRENAWLEKEARMAVLAARKGAQATGKQAMTQAYAGAVRDLGSAAVAGYEWATRPQGWYSEQPGFVGPPRL